jgi:glucose-6-phosphate 1-dehydrogenase
LYDVAELAGSAVDYDRNKLRKALILFGVTADRDWRTKDFSTIDHIDQRSVNNELTALLRARDSADIAAMKQCARDFLSQLLRYEDREKQFMDRFLDRGEYEPELLFDDAEQAQRLKQHPAMLWKLQNHRKYLGLET